MPLQLLTEHLFGRDGIEFTLVIFVLPGCEKASNYPFYIGLNLSFALTYTI